MAISTYPVTLKTGATEAASTKLCDIKSFPDLGSAPTQLDATTLSDAAKVYIAGITDTGQLEFTANYSATDLAAVNALTTATVFWLEFGTSGASGIYTFTGTASGYINGGGVDEVVEMTITVTPSTAITKYTAT